MARSGEQATQRTLAELMRRKEIVVSCGAGGVGKTTTAAALGVMTAAHVGGRVLVLTVDPAKRLADALGLDGLSDTPSQVPREVFDHAGVEPAGELWASMLDTKQAWDRLVQRHSPDLETASRILSNPLYENITTRFVQSHGYIAMERLYELHTSGEWDLIVIDTPPTRNALDFLESPQRMAEFFQGRLLRLLTAPQRTPLLRIASKPFYQVASTILGSRFLEDLTEFFGLLQRLSSGFVQRSRAVEKVLRDERCAFVVVTTLEPGPVQEAEFFIGALRKRGLRPGAVVANKVLPELLLDAEAAAKAEVLRGEGRAALLAQKFVAEVGGLSPVLAERVLTELAENFTRFGIAARRDDERRRQLSRSTEVLVSVPHLPSDVGDLASLLVLGESLWNT
jgi:anion-transporting  ArsA/GET3 family ATPase